MHKKLPIPNGPYLVMGLGRAGEAALHFLLHTIGPGKIAAWDSSDAKQLRAKAAYWRRRGVDVNLGGDGTDILQKLGRSITLVKSPGIDMDVPLLQLATALNLEVLDELEIGWRACKSPIVAVTGTNGKSTTCSLIASVLQAAGVRPQIVGNTEFGPPITGADFEATIVSEVSSFQLEAAPTFLPDFAVFTNLTVEHLPRHRTMDAYHAAKQKMFVRGENCCGMAIVNVDDESGRRILAAVKAIGGTALSYGFSADCDVRVSRATWTMRTAEICIEAGGELMELSTNLPGNHNVRNVAAAVAFGMAAGFSSGIIAEGVRAAVAPPGRWERVDAGQSFDVIIDYAHTPDGYVQVLDAARSVTKRRGTMLHTVFGATGMQDQAKAQGCGKAAADFSDRLIITTGSAKSPRILRLREIRNAAIHGRRVEVVLDRRRAIEHAIGTAKPGDVVAILGLGALKRQIVDGTGTLHPHNDREAALSALANFQSCGS